MTEATQKYVATKGFNQFIASYLPIFSINMLGLVAVRIWIQCNLYDRYTSTDSGLITIASNLFRIVVIIILIVLATKKGFSARTQKQLGYLSVVAMTLASVLFLINSETPGQELPWVACFLAGFGIAWGGGMWITVFVRLAAGEALLYAFLSLGLSCIAGVLLGLIPAHITYLIAMLMPALSLVAYQHAHRIIDKRERGINGEETTSMSCKKAYDNEPRSTFVRLIVGIALFNFALGIARGFPSGESIALPPEFQIVHQLGTALLSFLLIWWALMARRVVRFSTLWNISVTLVAVGVIILASVGSFFMSTGATLIAIANTFCVGLLWFSVYDIARNSSTPAYFILGIAWITHILPREVGRTLIWTVGPHSTEAIFIIAGIVLLVAASMGLLLNNSIPITRPLFAEFRTPETFLSWRERMTSQASSSKPASPPSCDTAGKEQPSSHEEIPSRQDALEPRTKMLQTHYLLTDREAEVVLHLAQGRSKTAIGEKLFISENTVRTYVKNIYQKLDIHSKQELLDLIDEQSKSSR